jgi:quercetin dioxygenase-like cupin family protein
VRTGPAYTFLEAHVSGLIRRSFDSPEEVRPFEDGSGRLDLVNVGDGSVGRAVFEPGWQWSKHVKPIAGTESCQAAHAGYVISGHMKVVMDGGEEKVFSPGDVMVVPPGHDAWTIGDQACVVVDWQGFGDYAKR